MARPHLEVADIFAAHGDAYGAARAHVDHGEVRMPVRPIERDEALGRNRAAPELRFHELEPFGQGELRAVRLAGDRAADRFALGLHDARHGEAARARADVGFERDRSKERLVKRVERAGEHAEGRSARFALLAAEDRQQGLALLLVGLLVDDGLRFTMPFMDRPWPREQTDPRPTHVRPSKRTSPKWP